MRVALRSRAASASAVASAVLPGLGLPRFALSGSPNVVTAARVAASDCGASGSARWYSVTAPLLGGRHTTSRPEREKHWHQHISKKASKRYKRRREQTQKEKDRDRTTAENAALKAHPPPEPSFEELEAMSRENRAIITSMTRPEPPPVAARDALLELNPDTLLAALRAGALEPTQLNYSLAVRVCGAHGRFDDAVAVVDEMSAAGIAPTAATFNALITACANQRNSEAANRALIAMREAAVDAALLATSTEDARIFVSQYVAATHSPQALLAANAASVDDGGSSAKLEQVHGDSTQRRTLQPVRPGAPNARHFYEAIDHGVSTADAIAMAENPALAIEGPLALPGASGLPALAAGGAGAVPLLGAGDAVASAGSGADSLDAAAGEGHVLPGLPPEHQLPLHALVVHALAQRDNLPLPRPLREALDERILGIPPPPRAPQAPALAASGSGASPLQLTAAAGNSAATSTALVPADAVVAASADSALTLEAPGMPSPAGDDPTFYSPALLTAAATLMPIPLPAAASALAPNTITYGALIQAHVKALDLPSAFQALQAAATAGVPLNAVHFTELIVGCVHDGLYERAWDVYKHMQRHHTQPDAVTYTALINACAKTDQFEKAFGLLQDMKNGGVKPTAVTYNAIIHAAGRSFRRCDYAFDLFEEMVTVGGHAHDDYSYGGVILACSHRGDVERARKYLHRMAGEGLTPSVYVLNTLLAVYARAFRVMALSKNAPKPTLEDMTAEAAEGADLLRLEDPATADAILAAQRVRVVGDYARVVQGDIGALAEQLLADYYGSDSETNRVADPLEERVANESVIDEFKRAKEALATSDGRDVGDSLLPRLSELAQDIDSREYRQAKAELIADGVDAALFERFEADNARYPALDSDEEMARMAVDRRIEKKERRELEARVRGIIDRDRKLRERQEEVDSRGGALADRLGLLDGAAGSAAAAATATAAGSGASDAEAEAIAKAALKRAVSGPLMASMPEVARASLTRFLTGNSLMDDVQLGSVTSQQPGIAAGGSADAPLLTAGAAAAPASSALQVVAGEGTATAPAGHKKRRPSLSEAIDAVRRPDGRVAFDSVLMAVEANLEATIFGDTTDEEVAAARGAELGMRRVIEGRTAAGDAAVKQIAAGGSGADVPAVADATASGAVVAAAGSDAAESTTGSTGAKAVPLRHALALSAPDSVSLFAPDAVLGGQKVKDLLDVTTIPIPDTSDSEGDHDVDHLEGYFADIVGRRIADALDREFGNEDAIASKIDTILERIEEQELRTVRRYADEDAALATIAQKAKQMLESGEADIAISAAISAANRERAQQAKQLTPGAPDAAPQIGAGSADGKAAQPTVPQQLRALATAIREQQQQQQQATAPAGSSARKGRGRKGKQQQVSAADASAGEDTAAPASELKAPAGAASAAAAAASAAAKAAAAGVTTSGDASAAGATSAPTPVVVEPIAAPWGDAPRQGMVRRRRSGTLTHDAPLVARAAGQGPPTGDAAVAAVPSEDATAADAAGAAGTPAEVEAARTEYEKRVAEASAAASAVSNAVSSVYEAVASAHVKRVADQKAADEAAAAEASSTTDTEADAEAWGGLGAEAPGAAAAKAEIEAEVPIERRIIARLMSRMLRKSVIPSLDKAIVAAAEGDVKARIRQTKREKPTLLDTMFAVEKVKETVTAGVAAAAAGAAASGPAAIAAGTAAATPLAIDATSGSSALVPSDALATVGAASPVPVAAPELTVRQQHAVAAAAHMVRTEGGAARLEALAGLSQTIVAGAHWLPRRYPVAGNPRKRVLLEEMRRIYMEELPRMGVQPDQVTLNTILAGYCFAGQNKLAYGMLTDDYPRHGLAPDSRTYRALIGLHVRQKRTERAEEVLSTMKATGVQPDAECYGLVVHSLARDWRVREAIALIEEMQGAGLTCAEHWAFLLRQRCKEMKIFHPSVPAHPVAWQFTPAIMKKRRAYSRVINKVTNLALRPKIAYGMR